MTMMKKLVLGLFVLLLPWFFEPTYSFLMVPTTATSLSLSTITKTTATTVRGGGGTSIPQQQQPQSPFKLIWNGAVISTKSKSKSTTHLASSSTTALDPSENDNNTKNTPKKTKKRKKSLFVTIWVHVVSIFIMANYRKTAFPPVLAKVPFATLSFIHAISGMLFSGSIITTTVLEWMVVNHNSNDKMKNDNNNNNDNNKTNSTLIQTFWFDKVPQIEKWVVLPALTGSIVSGIGQAFSQYGSFKAAPRHVKTSLHLLLLFGLWWGITDRTTQTKAQEQAAKGAALTTTTTETTTTTTTESGKESSSSSSSIPSVYRQRRISNIVSCVFLVALYGVMVLKPGYTPPPLPL